MTQNVLMPVEQSMAPQIAVPANIRGEECIPTIDAEGRISVPGLAHGLTIETYLPLVHLYMRILEANRILDRYRDKLRYHASGCNDGQDQSPLTSLQPSRLIPHLYYKREDQTVTRAYKVRGALVAMAKAMENQQSDRFIAVSTGNHAMGILKAAEILKPSAIRIVAPHNTAPWKLEKINKAITALSDEGTHAELLLQGTTFDEARTWALAQHAENPTESYIDPYSNPWVVAGQGTLGFELLNQVLPLVDEHLYERVSIISPVGGGGLLTGTAAAFKMSSAWDHPRYKHVHAQLTGMRLEDMNAPLGDAIRVGEVAPSNFALLNSMQVPLRSMSNDHMRQGVEFVKNDIGDTVEGASGGAVYPTFADVFYQPSHEHMVVSILSGGNT